MVKPCFPVSSFSCFLCCVFLSSFFVNSLVSLTFPPRPDQIEILLAFKNEFPITKCNFNEWPYSKPVTKSWTNKNVSSFDGVVFDNKTGVVTKLDLYGACLIGTLNANNSLFRFHHLRYLDLSFNHFGSSSFLAELGKLTNLEVLNLSFMNLVGEIPPSIGNLSRLTDLDLSNNKLTGSFLPNLTKLSSLDLSHNHFSGIIPCSLLNMPFLSHLDLSQNHLSDSLETLNCSSSSSKLEWLDLSYNFFKGGILEPSSNLSNLKHFDLSFQNSTYPINFVSIGFKSLESMHLSGNRISRLDTDSPNLSELVLYNCSINEFPTFIKNLKKLRLLYISHNRLKGQVPEWLWNLPCLNALVLSHSFFSGFGGSPKMLLNSSLGSLDLRSNAIRGSLPIIPPRLLFMLASNNNFSGEIPVSFCNQSSLGVLDLSDNNFSGSIPGCLSKSVEDLNLRNNNLIGSLPDIFDNNGSLVTLDVGHNQITGKLPSSLAKCKHLEILNMEGNRISDTFPFWLKDLPKLKVIVLRSNRFHGPIYSPQHPLSFPELQIMDISRNNFNGSLSPNYFVNWSTRQVSITEEDEMYMGDTYNYEYNPSMYLRNKGLNMELEKILVTYTAIDFSGNKLRGQIPESIGLLKSLIVLNLSNNGFNGHIPSSLGKLTKLESLDLSRNQISGKIPRELATLSFLGYIDISHNKLIGQIPQCTQFGGQPKSSFEGNINLCGLPLRESCFKGKNVPSTQHPKALKKEQVLNWKAAAIGYGPGVLFGLVIGQVFASYKPVLFFKLFRL